MKRFTLLCAIVACTPHPVENGPTLPTHQPVEVATSQPVEPAVTHPNDPWFGRTDLIQPPPALPPAPVNLPAIDRFTLPNGLKVLVVANHDLPIVSWELAIQAGSLDETWEKRGISRVAARMLTKGTTRHSADEISQMIDSVGGSLGAAADPEATHLQCATLAKDTGVCTSLVSEIAASATFPDKELPEVQRQLATEIQMQRQQPDLLARLHFLDALWGDLPRGWPTTIDTVSGLKQPDVAAFAKTWYAPNNAVLAIAGDVDAAKLKADLTKAFAGWKQAKVPERKAQPEPTVKGVTVRLVDKPDQTQSQIVLGNMGVKHTDPDYFATVVMNEILGGGGFSSRLMQAVRVKGGKTYGAYSHVEATRERGALYQTTFTANATTVATLSLVRAEIKRLRDDGPTAQELADAEGSLAGSYPIGFQNAADVASAVVSAELHGLGDDYVRNFPVKIAAVTIEDVKAAAKQHLAPDDLAIVIVGKAADVAPQLQAANIPFETVDYLQPIAKKDREVKTGPVDPARAAAGQKLIDAAIKAVGGEAKLRGIKDMTATGKIKISAGKQSLEGTLQQWTLLPSDLRVDITVQMGAMSMAVTDKGAWQKTPMAVQDLAPPEVADARAQIWRDAPEVLLHAKDADVTVTTNPPETVNGKAYDSVTLLKGGAPQVTLLLDPETHLIFRTEFSANGAKAYEELSDWRTKDGLALPYARHTEAGQQAFDVTLTEIKVNAGVAPSTFDKPAK